MVPIDAEAAVSVAGGIGGASLTGAGGRATVDNAEANDWLEDSSSPRIAKTALRPFSVFIALLSFFFQLPPALLSRLRLLS